MPKILLIGAIVIAILLGVLLLVPNKSEAPTNPESSTQAAF